MPDEFFTRTPAPGFAPPARARRPFARVFALIVLAIAGGAALFGWLVWDGRVRIDPTRAAPPVAALAPAPSAPAHPAADVAALDAHLAALEARIARIDSAASAAAGQTAEAEALLVALATRRALERGAPLGPLADQLRQRFGADQRAAVDTLAAPAPVTLDQLTTGLDPIAAALVAAPPGEDRWTAIQREFSGLFVLRRGGPQVQTKQDVLAHARLLLRTGQADAAAAEIARLPANNLTRSWAAAARRYAEVQRALDQIDRAALAMLPPPAPASENPL